MRLRRTTSRTRFLFGQSAEPPADEQEVLDAIRQAGGRVDVIAANTDEHEVSFHLASAPVTDDKLALVARLNNVVWLNLRGTAVTDEGLRHLAGLSKLRRLHLERTGIGDAGLAHLAGLTELEYLNIYGTQVSDEGLRHLAGLKKLRRLFVWQSRVTPAGMAWLGEQLPDLEIVGAQSLAKEMADDVPPRPRVIQP